MQTKFALNGATAWNEVEKVEIVLCCVALSERHKIKMNLCQIFAFRLPMPIHFEAIAEMSLFEKHLHAHVFLYYYSDN